MVASDEREGGRRALLNYGHTLAHALEIATDHELAHGEAVAVGLIFAAELALELGRIDEDRVDEHRAVVAREYDLMTTPPVDVDVDELVALMRRDKKAIDRSHVCARRLERRRGRHRSGRTAGPLSPRAVPAVSSVPAGSDRRSPVRLTHAKKLSDDYRFATHRSR